jgi:hypothetical protein
MNDYIYVPQLYEVLRDTYRRDADRLHASVAGQSGTRRRSPALGARVSAAWHAIFAHDGAGIPARGGQSA